MDLSTVKAEIKAWERDFKASNGRDPTIQDIKSKPDIASKYKLYKKLSKNSVHPASDPPSTPTRSRSRSHQPLPNLLAQPREIATTAPLSSFNPFSPRKKKIDVRNRRTQSSEASSSVFNPSPLFPSLDLPQASRSSLTPPRSPPTATTALSRARKRLRGESVSPSPVKSKRRQITSKNHLPFATTKSGSPSSEEDDGKVQKNLFVSESPIKAPPGAKTFKVLFHETPISTENGLPTITGGASPAQPKKSSTGALGSRLAENARRSLDGIGVGSGTAKHRAVAFKATASTTSRATQLLQQEILVDHETTTGKRPLSGLEGDATGSLSARGTSLLPPSPSPPDTSAHRPNHHLNPKGKGKVILPKHKKARTTAPASNADNCSGGDTDSSEPIVKLAGRKLPRRRSSFGDDLYPDTDPMTANPRPVPHGPDAPSVGDDASERFEVDLPDKLRNILALETSEYRARHVLEEKLVRGLVLGRRTDHYDPAKGGEIWDVGEDNSAHDVNSGGHAEDEDDWEGEPVPWEVGEL